MPKRTTTAELRDRLDGLGIALFAVTGAVVEALTEFHPHGDELWELLQAQAFATVVGPEMSDEAPFKAEAIEQAFAAVAAAFAGWREAGGVQPEGDNDNEQE
ncbi:hypothetical protein [Lichenifustis flavocetrariae]|uniref:Uncharacterized protein n=1 Tax=Lichenifustis flavocetrariae TaxID=2949735 RepID=A0AA42CMF1_9HYPH|nr:hypothetical protein [Lichenifustis flavocetrariae]MCW6512619.1 hypothetical protein [Lichenifustis flavocetrariae]